ncbi:MAG: PaaI family thioesterase [Geminicoccaceae bacterium]|nr:PaaI family thioesterase [Geminicoccaceae bacterium]MCS7268080.1 PaaI family thioesterase [Geminicoccaceae bacterium]MDW8125980.1 PaaI family thioesterase [Geminicoccaceae bacterium]MDW8342334.1 PaaI family thioesterase [Geminicoccaceae bacterium]
MAGRMTAEEFEELATRGVPYVGQLGCRVRRFEPGRVEVELPWQEMLVRPGGTICGPAMFALADITLYGVVLSLIGRVELAVTTDLTMHFLSRPRPGDLAAEGRILRLGTRLAVGEVVIRAAGRPEPVAHAVGTYAIPLEAGGGRGAVDKDGGGS